MEQPLPVTKTTEEALLFPRSKPESRVSQTVFPKANITNICTFSILQSLHQFITQLEKRPLTVLKSEIDSLRLVIVNFKLNQPVTHQCLDDCFLWWHTGFPSVWSNHDPSATLVLTVEQYHHMYVPLMLFTIDSLLLDTHTHTLTYLPVRVDSYVSLSEFVLIVKRKIDGNQQSSQVVMMLMFLP